ncbi:conserved hypothetical protein [Candidatus Terasakiella magnetica]|nr:conserved hypothetical protein [Candidatus Terasakiella magnetica]
MQSKQRHCLPTRIGAMLAAMTQETDTAMRTLKDDACRCADRQACSLWSACKSIHCAFLLPRGTA